MYACIRMLLMYVCIHVYTDILCVCVCVICNHHRCKYTELYTTLHIQGIAYICIHRYYSYIYIYIYIYILYIRGIVYRCIHMYFICVFVCVCVCVCSTYIVYRCIHIYYVCVCVYTYIYILDRCLLQIATVI